ncbi:MAG TPA: hypothetical protein DCW74_13710 [Alteromonas australica]|uniref:Uncharacterized protein n=1 Tax=Alteromonas australica TaxID=589873 RepID=A0A350P661_9ALTE|nr:hypothetical protein [Alteromonas australica]|tara:strand:+ start:681 stop:995 length:315 start_codon:yes stop_codon:yes gene_type:complete
MPYASDKYAYGICDITGFRYRRKDMKKTWQGFVVGPDQFDAKHPQLFPRKAPPDPQAIKDARPDTADDNNFFQVYTNVGDGILGKQLDTYEVTTSLGEITVTTS